MLYDLEPDRTVTGTGENKMVHNSRQSSEITNLGVTESVPDLWHFYMDSDPRISTSD